MHRFLITFYVSAQFRAKEKDTKSLGKSNFWYETTRGELVISRNHLHYTKRWRCLIEGFKFNHKNIITTTKNEEEKRG